MKFLGVPIFTNQPIVCNNEHTECPEHGFGIGMQRGAFISQALAAHADLCRDEQTGQADYAKLVAGPDLELFTAAEVLFAGYCLDRNSIALRKWEYDFAHQRAYHELVHDVAAQQQVKGGVMFNFGQTGPASD